MAKKPNERPMKWCSTRRRGLGAKELQRFFFVLNYMGLATTLGGIICIVVELKSLLSFSLQAESCHGKTQWIFCLFFCGKNAEIKNPPYCTLKISAKWYRVTIKPRGHMVTHAYLAENFHVLPHFSQ